MANGEEDVPATGQTERRSEVDRVFAEALARHRAGRLAEAAALYDEVLALAPAHADALQLSGIVAAQSGRAGEAVGRFEQVLRLRPDHHDVLYNLGKALREQGRLAEAIERYRQALRLQPAAPDILNNLGNALKEQGRPDEAAGLYRQALRVRPAFPEALCNLGQVLHEQGRTGEAIDHYRHALRLRPDYPEALNNLGNAYRDQGRAAEATGAYEQALRLRPDDPAALCNLGAVLQEQGRLEAAVARYRQALGVKPAYPEALNNLGNALGDLGQPDEALICYGQAIAIAPDYAEAHWNQSLVRLLTGDFAAGWAGYEWRWRRRHVRPHRHRQPLWDGSRFVGQTILLHCEQGFGDSLQFIRLARQVKARGGTVVLACPKPLVRLFHGVAGVDLLAGDDEPLPTCDWQAPLLSLPLALGLTLTSLPAAAVPYLRPDPALVAVWRQRLAPLGGLRIGLVWRGNPDHRNDRNRSVPPELLAGLLAIPGCAFVGLQKGGVADDPAPFAGCANFTDISGDLADFAETAAVVAVLDLVVSVDTAVIHLTGALGCPGLVLLPFAPDWRWLLGRDDSPWYPSLHLFRQPAPGDWGSVIERVAGVCRERAGAGL